MLNVCTTGNSDKKESACNEGDQGSIPGSGRSPGEGKGNPLQYSCLEVVWGFPGGSVVKYPLANVGDAGHMASISGSGRSPEGVNGNPLQYCLENPIDRRAWWATVHRVTKTWA